MTGSDLHSARHRLGVSCQGLAQLLKMGRNGYKAIREMERGARPITGPIQTAVELMLKDIEQ